MVESEELSVVVTIESSVDDVGSRDVVWLTVLDVSTPTVDSGSEVIGSSVTVEVLAVAVVMALDESDWLEVDMRSSEVDGVPVLVYDVDP